MTLLILVLAALIILAGLALAVQPAMLLDYLRAYQQTVRLHFFAVVVRALLGVALINQATLSKFPLIISLFGWLSLIAALVFALMGRERFQRFISWGLQTVAPFARVSGVLAVVFGGFLLYAFMA